MGRKKQRPHRSGFLNAGGELNTEKASSSVQKDKSVTVEKPFYVEIDRSNRDADQHFDISEVLLTNLNINPEFSADRSSEGCREASNYILRCRLCNVNELVGRFKLGHWPMLPASDIYLEFMEYAREDKAIDTVMVSGNFDGPDEGVTGLIHLISLKFLTLRPLDGFSISDGVSSVRVRVEILKKAFDACDSLLDITRQLWKRSMMSVMAWLRPEVATSEARYGFNESIGIEHTMDENSSNSRKRARFDAAGFYEAIKPSKGELMLEDDIPDLLPELRPYQRRAVNWMVQREKGSVYSSDSERSQFLSPLCMQVNLIDTCSTMFYNPLSGAISLHPESSPPYIFGGILADEMGLGKTIELLACVFAHKKSEAEDGKSNVSLSHISEDQNVHRKRLKRERVECTCGAITESYKYNGLWVQCDMCDAWQHADCVDYTVRGKTAKSKKSSSGKQGNDKRTDNTKKHRKRKNDTKIALMDGDHICQLCSELVEATVSPVATGATLIVCPSPILSQWHAEILRHTRPGSLRTYVYEGVRNASLASITMMDITELISSDIVLTTYDVLKEDLSHDSDRYEGDRRFMRFQKKYPVIPTPLTRIYWWRVCLDEAQMVESNTASATEMALRLHAKYHWCITGTPIQRKLDDLFGLIKFLKASPFDVFKWWVEVIRDPYEREDAGAMRLTHYFFKQMMWRSSKAHVAEELLLPPQDECLTWLSLSPIEEHFYQRQHETCVRDANEVIESFNDDILKQKITGSMLSGAKSDFYITHVEAAKLLSSLLKLRQACCHPQVGSSGLRSLQQSPMSMDEILSVLVGKTKVEGEEALRKTVVALNGLAGVAVIKQEFSQAVSLYKEALALADEHSDDFRLDPLLSIHIHHNLVEILPLTSKYADRFDSNEGKECDKPSMIMDCNKECDLKDHAQSSSFSDICLRCENLKHKFLSVSNSRLSVAQQEFSKTHVQVCDALGERKERKMVWWLDALHHIEQNKDSSSELIKKIGEAVSSIDGSRMSKIPSRALKNMSSFRSISSLSYYIQTGLDALEDSRRTLLDRLLDIDQTMDDPREEDIERVRYCPNCHDNGEGRICIHCEMNELFQVYEVRLFRLNEGDAEKAVVDLQKNKSALKRFYNTLSKHEKYSTSSSLNDEENGSRRDAREKVVVFSRSPSELEVVLGVIKNFSRALLERSGSAEAAKHFLLLEGMRKEYSQARSLASAQAQVLCAHDEMKMATSRLRLRDNEDDQSIDVLSYGELDVASAENLSDKFMALASLLRIKGQLRYLQGLVQAKEKKEENESSNKSPVSEVVESTSTTEKDSGVKVVEEACPICQEKLINQKMVFQCGHFTCCKCLFALIEQRLAKHGKSRDKWVMCPTCRQHTDFGNIAFADDEQMKTDNFFQGGEESEASITVQGSYGTKIEAITRRILWITSKDPSAKLLVFSSWNDVLDVLEHAFVANSISCIRMKGGRKAHVSISQFKGEKCSSGKKGRSKKLGQRQLSETRPVQVLLLLIQHGANGLNLLEAQHVILVEPLLNPAAEAQAIGRVHRIGQKNNTFVHRFIVKNTVEESIYKLNRSRSTSSFISGNKRNQNEPVLTVKDIESLLMTKTPSTWTKEKEIKTYQRKKKATINVMQAPTENPKQSNKGEANPNSIELKSTENEGFNPDPWMKDATKEPDQATDQTHDNPNESLMHFPPSVAAALAAERRLMESKETT